MTKEQDSGLSCFMIVMKFHGVPITKEQAERKIEKDFPMT